MGPPPLSITFIVVLLLLVWYWRWRGRHSWKRFVDEQKQALMPEQLQQLRQSLRPLADWAEKSGNKEAYALLNEVARLTLTPEQRQRAEQKAHDEFMLYGQFGREVYEAQKAYDEAYYNAKVAIKEFKDKLEDERFKVEYRNSVTPQTNRRLRHLMID